MGAKIIDGKAIADKIRIELQEELKNLKADGVEPGIATLLVGDDSGAKMDRKAVERFCGEMGFAYREETHPADTSEEEVIKIVGSLNDDRKVSGILPLRPFPAHVADSAVINSINVNKDVDCFHPFNMGKVALGEPSFPPATPAACVELMERYMLGEGIDPKDGFEGAEICVVGHSNIVGKPVSFLVLNRNATITTSHVFTSMKGNLEKHTTAADYLIVAAGVPNLINSDQVKEGATLRTHNNSVDANVYDYGTLLDLIGIDQVGDSRRDYEVIGRRGVLLQVALHGSKHMAGRNCCVAIEYQEAHRFANDIGMPDHADLRSFKPIFGINSLSQHVPFHQLNARGRGRRRKTGLTKRDLAHIERMETVHILVHVDGVDYCRVGNMRGERPQR